LLLRRGGLRRSADNRRPLRFRLGLGISRANANTDEADEQRRPDPEKWCSVHL